MHSLRLFLVLLVTPTLINNICGCRLKKNNEVLIALIRDFVSYQTEPTRIFAHLCFKKHDNVMFHKNLSLMNVPNTPLGMKGLKDAVDLFCLFLLDLSCPGSTEVLEEAQKYRLFQNPHKWLVVNYKNDQIDLLKNLPVMVDSKFFIFEQTSHGSSSFKLKTLFKFGENDLNFYFEDVAMWHCDKGFDYYNHLVPPKNRSDLIGTKIKISYVVTNLNTLNHLWDYREKHIDSITKVNYVLVNHLMDITNASKEFVMQRSWGYQNLTTKLYDGMIGDLQREKADLGGTPAFFTMDRVTIIDFIAATTPTHMKFIFKAPPLSYVTNVFTLPFDTYVWYASYIMILITFVVLYLIVFWEWKDPLFKKHLEELNNENVMPIRPKALDVFMLEIGAVTQQGTDVEPKSLSGRITTIFIFTILMFMYTSYSANIVALLQSTTDSFKSLDDLLHSRIKLGVEDIVYAHHYFSIAEEPVRKAIYEQKIAPKGQPSNFMEAQVGIKKMRNDFFAFHIELSTGYKIVGDTFQEDEKCNLKEIEFVRLIEPWISIRKNSSYKEIMKVGMRKLHESGIQNREVFRVYTKKPVCLFKGSNFVSVGLIDCYFPFVLFGIGTSSAVIILLVEIGISRHYSYKRKCVVTITNNTPDTDGGIAEVGAKQ